MGVLVDTNVLVDVLTDDPRWAGWSLARLEEHEPQGLLVNPAIYAELCFGFDSHQPVDELLRQLGLLYQEIPRLGLFRASRAFALYRSRGGTRERILPAFFVGGHAEASGLPVLTRDTGRFTGYFPSVDLIRP
jgi:predicted nucleic acid-binding protein